MTEKKLFTCEDKPHALSERTVYLTLIAEEIRLYGVGHNLSDYNRPVNLSVDYLEFRGMYWKTLETCLREFNGMMLSEFTDDYKTEIINIYRKETKQAINKTTDYIQKKVAAKEKKLPLKLRKVDKANDKLKTLLKERAYHKMIDDEKLNDVNEVKINIRKLPKSTIKKLETRVKEIAKNSLMIEALDHAEKRATFDKADPEKKKYRFKKFKRDIRSAFKDLLIKSDKKIKPSKLQKSDAQIINEAAQKYEIIGNSSYLHNTRKFKKALGQYIRPRLKRLRKKHDKPES